jgi:hypothetical protein
VLGAGCCAVVLSGGLLLGGEQNLYKNKNARFFAALRRDFKIFEKMRIDSLFFLIIFRDREMMPNYIYFLFELSPRLE